MMINSDTDLYQGIHLDEKADLPGADNAGAAMQSATAAFDMADPIQHTRQHGFLADSWSAITREKQVNADHLPIARQALTAQSEAVAGLATRLGQPFNDAVNSILACDGHVVVCGMGKSGLVGKKLVATLASTGTPSFYLHSAEAFHGDLGMLTPADIVVLISYSGETDEVIRLIPSLKAFGNKTIALVGRSDSSLAKHSDIVLDISVSREVCPNNLAPTTSTLATMAMGDALAVALIKARNFQKMDFARFHPGGSLGRKLLTRVRDVMRPDLPVVSAETTFHDCLFAMSKGRMGLALVMREEALLGIVTDGDLRRGMISDNRIMEKPVKFFMKENPLTIDVDSQLATAEALMLDKKVRALVVTSGDNKKVCGVLELFTDGFFTL